jgi:uncharacterized protein YjbJ (UPF0337 family)
MVNQQMLEGSWNEITGKLRNKWGQLTGDDLQSARGNVDELVGLIQRKTGESRDAIQQYLEELTSQGGSKLNQTADMAREYAHQAMDTVQQRSRQAMDAFRDRYGDPQELVRERPAESLAVCFGIGIAVGLVLGMTLRGR